MLRQRTANAAFLDRGSLPGASIGSTPVGKIAGGDGYAALIAELLMGALDGEPSSPGAPLVLDRVTFRRSSNLIIDSVSLRLEADQHWAVIGANGSGKSTLLRIAALYEHPSSGSVTVLGHRLGSTDVRRLRRRVGYAAAGLGDQFRPELTASDVVMTAKNAALEPWWDRYDDHDRANAHDALAKMGVERLAPRSIGTLSSGERQRVLLARTLMNSPDVVVLDEPSAGLDIGGREQLVASLGELMTLGTPTLIVTHHLQEIPPATTHVLMLRNGTPVAAGSIDVHLTSATLSECFGLALDVERRSNGRYAAWAVT